MNTWRYSCTIYLAILMVCICNVHASTAEEDSQEEAGSSVDESVAEELEEINTVIEEVQYPEEDDEVTGSLDEEETGVINEEGIVYVDVEEHVDIKEEETVISDAEQIEIDGEEGAGDLDEAAETIILDGEGTKIGVDEDTSDLDEGVQTVNLEEGGSIDENHAISQNEQVSEDEDDDEETEAINTFREHDFIHDIDHMAEHTEHMTGVDADALSGEEKDFYFFKLHDFDNDNRLDGIEIMTSLRHGMKEALQKVDSRGLNDEDRKIRMDRIHNKLTMTVDVILREDDLDNDGYLTYTEFQLARRASVFLRHAKN